MPKLPVFSVILLASLATPALTLADTLISTQGPFTWTDSCSETMQVTLRVYKDVDGLTGLYKWDYEVHNTSVNSWDSGGYGIGDVTIYFPTELPEISNLYAPSGWDENNDATFVEVTAPLVTSGPGFLQAGLAPSSSMHFGFTTFPRQVTTADDCVADDDSGALYPDSCAQAQKASGYFQLMAAPLRGQRAPRSRHITRVISGRSSRRANGSCDYGQISGEIGIPDSLATGLQVSEPATPNAATSDSPGVTPATSSNLISDFATDSSDDLITVLKNSGTVTVEAVDIPSGAGSQVQWQMDRDPTDTVDSGTPSISGAPSTMVTFSPTTAGNFRLVAYIDADSSGTFDEGEQLAILRIAIVQATLQTGGSTSFGVTDTLAAYSISQVRTSGSPHAMLLQARYLLEGGGVARTIGATAISIGDVGNLLTDTFTVSYPVPTPTPPSPGNVSGTGAEQPGGTLPMVDTARVSTGSQPTGGITPFRNTSGASDVVTSTGRLVQLTSYDDPGFGWIYFHPTTSNLWGTTSGGNSFREFVVAFSSSFPETYLSLNQADWTVTAVGAIGSVGGTNQWVDTGSSSITGDSAPQSIGADPVQVLGLSFVNQASIQYTP